MIDNVDWLESVNKFTCLFILPGQARVIISTFQKYTSTELNRVVLTNPSKMHVSSLVYASQTAVQLMECPCKK